MFPNWKRDLKAKPEAPTSEAPKASVTGGSACCSGDGKTKAKAAGPTEAANASSPKKKSCCG